MSVKSLLQPVRKEYQDANIPPLDIGLQNQ